MAYEDYIPNTYKQLDEEDETTKRGVLDRVLSPLMNTSVTSALYNVTDDNPDTTFLGGIGAGLARQFNPLKDDVSDTHEFGDVLDNVLGKTTDKDSLTTKATRLAAGFVGDTLLDPMSYVGGVASGVGKILKGTSSAVDSVRAAENIAETGANVRKAVDINDCIDVVSKKYSKTNLDESSVIVESEAKNLLDNWNKKIERRKTDEEIKNSKGIVIGLCNLPFSSKFNTKLKESAIFEKELIKGEDLAKFGDRTVAPYYNKLSETLRRTKFGQLFNENNKIFAESFTNLNRALNNFSINEGKASSGADAVAGASKGYEAISKYESLDDESKKIFNFIYKNNFTDAFTDFMKTKLEIQKKIANSEEGVYSVAARKNAQEEVARLNKNINAFDEIIADIDNNNNEMFNVDKTVSGVRGDNYHGAKNVYQVLDRDGEIMEDGNVVTVPIDSLLKDKNYETFKVGTKEDEARELASDIDKEADLRDWLETKNGTDDDGKSFIWGYLKDIPEYTKGSVIKRSGGKVEDLQDYINANIDEYVKKKDKIYETLVTLPEGSKAAESYEREYDMLSSMQLVWEDLKEQTDISKIGDPALVEQYSAELKQLEAEYREKIKRKMSINEMDKLLNEMETKISAVYDSMANLQNGNAYRVIDENLSGLELFDSAKERLSSDMVSQRIDEINKRIDATSDINKKKALMAQKSEMQKQLYNLSGYEVNPYNQFINDMYAANEPEIREYKKQFNTVDEANGEIGINADADKFKQEIDEDIKTSNADILNARGEAPTLTPESSNAMRESIAQFYNGMSLRRFQFNMSDGEYHLVEETPYINKNNVSEESLSRIYSLYMNGEPQKAQELLNAVLSNITYKTAFEYNSQLVSKSPQVQKLLKKVSCGLDEFNTLSPSILRYDGRDICAISDINDTVSGFFHTKPVYGNTWAEVKDAAFEDGYVKNGYASNGKTHKENIEYMSKQMTKRENLAKASLAQKYGDGVVDTMVSLYDDDPNFIANNIDQLVELDELNQTQFAKSEAFRKGIPYKEPEKVAKTPSIDYNKQEVTEVGTNGNFAEQEKQFIEKREKELKAELQNTIWEQKQGDKRVPKAMLAKQQYDKEGLTVEGAEARIKEIEKKYRMKSSNDNLPTGSDYNEYYNLKEFLRNEEIVHPKLDEYTGLTNSATKIKNVKDELAELEARKEDLGVISREEYRKKYIHPETSENRNFSRSISQENASDKPEYANEMRNSRKYDAYEAVNGHIPLESLYEYKPDFVNYLRKNEDVILSQKKIFVSQLEEELDMLQQQIDSMPNDEAGNLIGRAISISRQRDIISKANTIDELADTMLLDSFEKQFDTINPSNPFGLFGEYTEKYFPDITKYDTVNGRMKYFMDEFGFSTTYDKDEALAGNFKVKLISGSNINNAEEAKFMKLFINNDDILTESDLDKNTKESVEQLRKILKQKGYVAVDNRISEVAGLTMKDRNGILSYINSSIQRKFIEQIKTMYPNATEMHLGEFSPEIQRQLTKRIAYEGVCGNINYKYADDATKKIIRNKIIAVKTAFEKNAKHLEAISGNKKMTPEESISYLFNMDNLRNILDKEAAKSSDLGYYTKTFYNIMNGINEETLEKVYTTINGIEMSKKDLMVQLNLLGKEYKTNKMIKDIIPRVRSKEAEAFLDKAGEAGVELTKDLSKLSIADANKLMARRTKGEITKWYDDDISSFFTDSLIATGKEINSSKISNNILAGFGRKLNPHDIDLKEGEELIVKRGALKKYIERYQGLDDVDKRDIQKIASKYKNGMSDAEILQLEEEMNKVYNRVNSRGRKEIDYDALAEFGLTKEMLNNGDVFIKLDPIQYKDINFKLYSGTGENSVTLNAFAMNSDDVARFNAGGKYQKRESKNAFMDIYDKFLGMYKTFNTVINPGFHINNAVGNAFNSFMYCGAASCDPAKLNIAKTIITNPDPKQYIVIGETKYSYKQINDMLKHSKVIGQGFFDAEALKDVKGLGNVSVAGQMKNYTDLPLIKKGLSIGSEIEEVQRTALFIEALRNGETPYNAKQIVNKFLFDYSDLTDEEVKIMKRAIPFYTFMRKNVPFQLTQIMEQPHTYITLEKALDNFERLSGEDYVPEEDRNEWRRDYVQIPFKLGGKNVGINLNLPSSQLDRLAPNQILGQASPVIKAPIELATGQYAYTGMPINNVGEYIESQFSPVRAYNVTQEKEGVDKTLYPLGYLTGFPMGTIKR